LSNLAKWPISQIAKLANFSKLSNLAKWPISQIAKLAKKMKKKNPKEPLWRNSGVPFLTLKF